MSSDFTVFKAFDSEKGSAAPKLVPEPTSRWKGSKPFTTEDATDWSEEKEIKDCIEKLLNFQRCTPFPLVDMEVLDGPLCGQPVYLIPKTCECVTFNPTTKSFEEIPMSTKIGLNTTRFTFEERPFTCEIPAPVGGGPVTVTNADIIASLAGATVQPSGLPADDAATVYLHEIEGVLTGVNDEASDGFVSTSCQAVATDVETGKAKDIEPGGNYESTVKAGADVPEFSIEIAEGSNMVFCGRVSVKFDKANEVVPK